MASDDGSIVTNPFPMAYTPYLNTWDCFGNYGEIPSAPATEPPSSGASAGLENQLDPAPRVASPGTKARQQELGRLILAERQRYLENANSSEAGSVMDIHMLNYMRELEEGANVTAPALQATSSTTSHTNTTNVINNGSYLNLHGGLLNDERRIRVEQGRNVTGHTNPHANLVDDFNANGTLGQGSTVQKLISRVSQPRVSFDNRQPSFTEVGFPGSSNYGGLSAMGQIAQPDLGKHQPDLSNIQLDLSIDHAQSTIGRLGGPSSVHERRQSDVGRLGQPFSANDQEQFHIGRRGQPSSANDQGQSNVGRLNQEASANDQARSANQPRSNLREVNFTSGIYGRITQVEQTNHETYGGHAIITSAEPDSCSPSAFATANDVTNDLTNGLNGHIHNTRSGSDISEASSTSTLRRRPAFNDLAHEAGYECTAIEYEYAEAQDAEVSNIPNITGSNMSALPSLTQGARQENTEVESFAQVAGHDNNVDVLAGSRIQTNMQGASMLIGTSGTTPQGSPPSGLPPSYNQNITVESAPLSTIAMPAAGQPTPVAAQPLPNITNGVPRNVRAAANGNQNAGVNANPPNIVLPPHLDINDPVGFDIMTALHAVGRLRNSINGLGAEATATDQVLAELNVVTTTFVTGFRRAAAAAHDYRGRYHVTDGLLSRARLAARAIQLQYQGAVAAAERAEERLAFAERGGERYRADLAAARFALARALQVQAQLWVRLAERRRESERLLGEVAELETVLYGHD